MKVGIMHTRQKMTNILLTTGEKIQTVEVIENLIRNGYLSYRVHLGKKKRNNFEIFKNILQAEKNIARRANIYLDLPSDRPRVDTLSIGDKRIWVKNNDIFRIIWNDNSKSGNRDILEVKINNLEKHIHQIVVNDRVQFKDGNYEAEIIKKEKESFLVRAKGEVYIAEMMSCLWPDSHLKYNMIDLETDNFLKKIANNGLCPDYFIVSFVNDEDDIIYCKKYLEKIFCGKKINIVAKLETPEAIENLDSILQVSDQIMIGRGDLAPQIGFEKMPKIQERIVYKAYQKEVPCIVATQFMDELAQNNHICAPELNDIFIALQQNVFAIMLAGEGAASPNSEKCVELLKLMIKSEQEKGEIYMDKNKYCKMTKIMATAGPTLQTVEEFIKAIDLGVNEYRIHMGLRSRDFCGYFYNVQRAAEMKNTKISVLLDLPSTRPRIKNTQERICKIGERVKIFDEESIVSNNDTDIYLPGLKPLIPYINKGDRIAFRDGKILFQILNISDSFIDAECIVSNVELKTNSSCNFPDSHVKYKAIDETDIFYLNKMRNMGLKPDWVALSFATNEEQISEVKKNVAQIWPNSFIKIMCKIENMEGINNIDTLLRYADGIMIARGDLLVNIDPISLPRVQYNLVNKARNYDKKVVIATEFFERFALTGVLNRAELSDVALAFREGCDSIMLSMETGNSKYNFQCIDLIHRLLKYEYEAQE